MASGAVLKTTAIPQTINRTGSIQRTNIAQMIAVKTGMIQWLSARLRKAIAVWSSASLARRSCARPAPGHTASSAVIGGEPWIKRPFCAGPVKRALQDLLNRR